MVCYRGSNKHKRRPGRGEKGTLCPEWTHETETKGLGNDPSEHDWSQTRAHQLFQDAEPHPDCRKERCYATMHGIAFEAKPANDGTWHGYPIPWKSVPPKLTQKWQKNGRVTRRQIRSQKRLSEDDIEWALKTDSNEADRDE